MSWFYLLLAGLMEIVGVIALKSYALSGKKIFLVGIGVQFALSLFLLTLALEGISVGVAYAIWTAIGTAGGVLVGIIFYKESKSFWKIFFIVMIILCSAGLKLLS
ncbi:DMT family transporter [Helicobacter burdigaliensis]|uniref:DMT family transporter n=1 Tax=Helicobacter burdigaliensis TaxID=2315334 RepID=UPI000EF73852|nr:SMR family transporter [Helicobacter burdigaliensis]